MTTTDMTCMQVQGNGAMSIILNDVHLDYTNGIYCIQVALKHRFDEAMPMNKKLMPNILELPQLV